MTKDEFARDADFCHQMTTVRSPGAMVGACRTQDFQS